MPSVRKYLPIWASAAVIMFAALSASAITDGAKPGWKETPFSYYANKQSLPELFINFGLSVGTEVAVDRRVKGLISGIFHAASPRLFLANICKKYRLDWYFDGQTLHISRIADRIKRSFKAVDGDSEALAERIRLNPAWNPQFRLLIDKQGVVISAPEQFMAVLSLSLKNPPETGRYASRVFPLKNSWAGDKTFPYRDKSVTFPGVVTTLKALYSGGGGQGGAAPEPPAPQRSVPSLIGVLGGGEKKDPPPPQQSPPPGGAKFQADERLNAVVVYDLESRMPMYEDIIARLDIESRLVEIEALLIDVDTNSMDDLGVNWNFKDGDFEILTNTANIEGGTLVGSDGGHFLVQLRMLEKEGRAKILSRPSVLTVDNVEALLDLHQTFHVRVQGERVANLYPVTIGTMLRVTPHVTERSGNTGVYVAISIQDGQMEQQQVDDIPLIKNNTINTQAFIAEGQSLLIGGYHYESVTTGSEGVPILSELPLLGWAFGQETKSTKKSERMYLITPRIIADKSIAETRSNDKQKPRNGEAGSPPAAPKTLTPSLPTT